MHRLNTLSAVLLLAASFATGCSAGSEPVDPLTPPTGSGEVRANLTGTWVIRGLRILEEVRHSGRVPPGAQPKVDVEPKAGDVLVLARGQAQKLGEEDMGAAAVDDDVNMLFTYTNYYSDRFVSYDRHWGLDPNSGYAEGNGGRRQMILATKTADVLLGAIVISRSSWLRAHGDLIRGAYAVELVRLVSAPGEGR